MAFLDNFRNSRSMDQNSGSNSRSRSRSSSRSSSGNLTYEEWLQSHHVPHPGARGNRNAAGPHNIPSDSLEKIREGGRKGGKAHLGMHMEVDPDKTVHFRKSKTSGGGNASSMKSSQRRSRSQNMFAGQTNQGFSANEFRDLIQEARDVANRLNEVLGDLGNQY